MSEKTTHAIVEPDTQEREIKTMAMLAQIMDHMYGTEFVNAPEESTSGEQARIAVWFHSKYRGQIDMREIADIIEQFPPEAFKGIKEPNKI